MTAVRSAPLFLAVAALAAPALAQGDEIVRKDGAIIRGVEVASETLKEVTYKQGRSDETIPAIEVRTINWGNTPDSFARAQIAVGRGDLETAANLFAEAADRGEGAAFKVAARFLAVDALVKSAGAAPERARTAAQAAQQWVDANGEHRLAPNALVLLGNAQIAAGNGDAALAAFQKLEQMAMSNTLGPLWSGEAKYGQAIALTAKKDFSQARQVFTAAYAQVSRLDPKAEPDALALSVRIKIGQGEAFIAQGDLRGARSFYEELNSLGARDPAFRAASLCGVGQALLEQGKKENDANLLRQAQQKFAEVSATDLLDGETSAKALYLLGRTMLTLGSEKEGKDVSSRAIAIFRQVVQSYPNSRWAMRARKELSN
jgi:tetratricopeptide (TPR) repeat protein